MRMITLKIFRIQKTQGIKISLKEKMKSKQITNKSFKEQELAN